MTEQQIQNKIIKELERQGAYVVKVVLGTKRGVPDLLVCYRGVFIGLECKRPRERLSVLQTVNGDKIVRAGGIFRRIESVTELQPILEAIHEQLRSRSEEADTGRRPAGTITEFSSRV